MIFCVDEKYIGEDEQSIGDLYLVSYGKEKEKIASKVKDGFYSYINSQDKVCLSMKIS
ncbi:hypothetical protein [Siminovitchia terrae]|uniref:hypothetical protein n=1 Tax=Siminovitchia terrae TaxID=1914933 RepID=UPI0028AAD771|nr:hypothetical protein [Siminovitchia terrae]